MILVTCGHEKGIGLEVFFKALLSNSKKSKSIKLFINQEALIEYLDDNKFHYEIKNNTLVLNKYLKIDCCFVGKNINPSMDSLLAALSEITKKDVLFTLPTSKDQFQYNNKQFNGYTEFFRHYYENENLLMSFIGPKENLLLLTDHLPIEKVTQKLTKEFIKKSVKQGQDFFKSINKLNKTYLLGLNPHAGENGLLGNDNELFSSLNNVIGPIPGDTINLRSLEKNDLVISSFHDQGLSFFKTKYKTMGINNTIGLGFKRVSLDHGTAFELFATNKANYSGCEFLLNEIYFW